MTQHSTARRDRIVPGLALDIDDVIDTPSMIRNLADEVLDDQLVAIIQCTQAFAYYVEELHAPHELDQFLTASECVEVARFIDALGDNPEREREFFEAGFMLVEFRGRNPYNGWTVEHVREAVGQAAKRVAETGHPGFVRESLVLLQTLVRYVDAFHGSSGFQQVLTPDERRRVGEYVTQLLVQPPLE